ncbi:ribonuclease P [Malassezia cuniculi]|uniref:Ribonuclease P n=1 Tax=Malassezia cuniculi TaxID=948313 RepID=A0AAF0J6S2_9BASI|nr:ribonuclease P [Malassezia cuniculi]
MSDGARLFAELLAPGSEAERHAQFDARVASRRVLLGNAPRAANRTENQGINHRAARVRREARRDGVRVPKKKNKPQRPSRAQKRDLGMLHPGKELSYEEALQISSLWTEYMQGLLSLAELSGKQAAAVAENPSWVANTQSTLLKADWTGATLRVVQATNPSLVHVHGIVTQETHETFIMISDSGARTVPKRNCVFRVDIPINSDSTLSIDLHGNQLRYSLPVRITRKHKARRTVELE